MGKKRAKLGIDHRVVLFEINQKIKIQEDNDFDPDDSDFEIQSDAQEGSTT